MTDALGEARRAAAKAYAPYSAFRVGACVRTSAGRLFAGCNVENRSFGGTICAERSALLRWVVERTAEERVVEVVLYTPTDRPVTPCGMCRQVLVELAPDAEVVAHADGGAPRRWTVRELLPDAFDADLG
jgi:cytidine deaminase